MSTYRPTPIPFALALVLGGSLLAASVAIAQPPGELFPEPFVVEHYVVEEEGDGTRFVSESVKDTYGGSWLVSERSDGSRMVLDLARREILEIRPEQGAYWRLSFSRLADLQSTVEDFEGLAIDEGGLESSEGGEAEKSEASPALAVREVTSPPLKASAGERAGRMPPALTSALGQRPGVVHLRIEAVEKASGGESASADVWVDPTVRLTPAARDALGAFEREALRGDVTGGAASVGGLTPAAVMKAVRDHAAGAFPVRVRRPVRDGVVEEIATRLEKVESFDRSLVRVPEGLRRVPHPLESVVAFMERDDEMMNPGRRPE